MTRDREPAAHADEGLDLRARAELSLAYGVGDPPAHLYRSPPALLRRPPVVAAIMAALGVAATLSMRPPALVRDAIEHEYYERTLRGTFMAPGPLLGRLGLGEDGTLPGYTQLIRPCDIDGVKAFHLTTFLERGGMVTVFAFEQPVTLREDSGWWNSVHWQVVRSRDGRPLLMVAQKKKALAAARASLEKPQG